MYYRLYSSKTKNPNPSPIGIGFGLYSLGGTENGDQIKYHYIDGSATRHNIVQNGSAFYDTSGLGLLLEEISGNSGHYGTYYAAGDVRNAVRKLTDRQGNMLFFDSLGRLAATRSVFYSGNKFEYADSSTKLASVTTAALSTTNAAQTERTAKFFYNSNDLLDHIEYGIYSGGTFKSEDNPSISFVYDSDLYSLKKITKSKTITAKDIMEGENRAVGTYVSRTIAEYGYLNGLLYETKDLGGQVLRFVFSGSKIGTIYEGAYNNSNVFQTRRSDTINYVSGVQTKVTNDKGVYIVYNMNDKGEMYSAFEENSNYSYAVSPQPDGYGYGQYFETELTHDAWIGQNNNVATSGVKSAVSEWFNQKQIVKINGGGAGVNRCLYTTIKNYSLINIEGESSVGAQTFTLSCWAKIDTTKTNKDNNIGLAFYVDYDKNGNTAERFYAHIDPKLKGWQFVYTTVKIDAKAVNWADLRINNNSSDAVLYVADVRMVQGGIPEYKIWGRYSDNSTVGWTDLKKIRSLGIVKGNNVQQINLSDDIQFTVTDIEQTRKNRYLANGYPYNLSLNNGKRLISNVNDVTLSENTNGAPNSDPNKDYLGHFYTEQFSGFKDNIKVETWTNFGYDSISEKRYMLTETKGHKNGVLKDLEQTWVGFDGLSLYRKDGYNVETSYTYDRWGNMTRMQMKSPGGKVCYLDNKYDTNGEHVIDTWDSRNSGTSNTIPSNTSVTNTLLNPSGLTSSITLPKEDSAAIKDKKTSFGYDALKDSLSKVNAWTDGGTSGVENKNELFFNSKGELEKLAHNGTNFDFEYDHFGRVKTFKVAGTQVLSKTYTSGQSNTEETTYANGFTNIDTTDKYGRVTKTASKIGATSDKDATINYYDKKLKSSSAAQIRGITDNFDGSVSNFYTNDNDKLMSYETALNGIKLSVTEKTPDNPLSNMEQSLQQNVIVEEPALLSQRKITYTNKAWTDEKIFNPKLKKTLASLQRDYGGGYFYAKTETDYDYDDLGRPNRVYRTLSGDILSSTTRTVDSTLTYFENSAITSGTTDFIKNHSIGGMSFDYTYHPSGQIKSVKKGSVTETYDYDKIGRLSKYTKDYATTSFTYDAGGNVLNASGSSSKSFAYSGDRLTNYNGQSVSNYDACGNPRNYRGSTMAWTRGRLLKSYKGVEYTYNKDGLRTSKKTTNTTNLKNFNYNYVYDGNKLISERWNKDIGTAANPKIVPAYNYYLYDAAGLARFIHVYYDGDQASSVDLIVITDTFGTVHELRHRHTNNVVASFSYDAWGKCTVNTHGYADYSPQAIFPFRWKGYYFDIESGFYMVYINGKTRYYDPTIMQFLDAASPDELDPLTIGGLNPYSICAAFGVDNPLQIPPNGHNISTSLPLVADGESSSGSGWTPPKWLGWAVSGLQLAAGIGLMFVPGAQGFGAMMIAGGAIGLASNAFGSSIGGGIGSMMNGGGAIGVGLSLMGLGGPIGIAGGVLALIGAGTMAFGANEIAYGITGNNYIQEWTGMSDSWYNGLYLGLNIASAVGQIAGRAYQLYHDRVPIINSKTGANKGYTYMKNGDKLYSVHTSHGGTMKFPHYHGWVGKDPTGGHWSYWRLLWWFLTGR